MFGGADQRRMSMNSPLPVNSRAFVASDPSTPQHVGENSQFPREDMQIGLHSQDADSLVKNSQKLQDDLQEVGKKIKHHEENINYLKNLRNKLEDSILDMQASSSKDEKEGPSNVGGEEETIQHILKYEKSAAALFCKMKYEYQVSDRMLTKDVVGVVATLGKVDDANLSRLLSEYLGLETMLAVVCKSYEGVKALEAYTKDGLINEGSGIHAFAASSGRPLDGRFLVICLENLRPYPGQVIADDPQRRLDLLKPRLINGEIPVGFLGFAVNMITIDNANLYCIPKTGHTLRETLFYKLFSNLHVYRSREDMLNAQPFISTGAISLDGGMIRSPGVFSLGRGDIGVKFPIDSKRSIFPANYYEIQNRLRETKWKKEQALEDLQMEEELLKHARDNYERKKKEFVRFLAESSSVATQVGRVSTPR